MGEIKMVNNNSRIFYAAGELLVIIPERNFSVNVGINVVGSEENAHERAGNKSERIANGVMN